MKVDDIVRNVDDLAGNKPSHEKTPYLLEGIFRMLVEIHKVLENKRP